MDWMEDLNFYYIFENSNGTAYYLESFVSHK